MGVSLKTTNKTTNAKRTLGLVKQGIREGLKKKELSLEPSCPIVWQERINIMYDILRLKAA